MDILNRDELERRLSRIVGRGLRSELNRLMDLLGDPPNLANVPYDYWQNGWRAIQKDVEPALLDIFLMQAEGLMAEIGIGASWDLVNTTASQWARQHTEQILQELFNTRYDHLNEIIPRFYEEGWNLGQLRTDLERYYSPVRAEMIAVTETTRAAVEGERALVEALQKESSIRMVPIWKTNNDELVCPLCGPRHGKEITDGIYPPRHPRCRCWVTYEFPEGEGVAEEVAPKPTVEKQISNYQNVGSRKEAEDFARDVLGLEFADYSGLPVDVMNEWNKSLYYYKQEFPELFSKIKGTGTTTSAYSEAKRRYTEYLYNKHPEWESALGKERALEWAKDHANKSIGRTPSNAYALSFQSDFWEKLNLNGVYINKNLLNRVDDINELMKKEEGNFHPIGHNSIKSILDHEVGHQLDIITGMVSEDRHLLYDLLFPDMDYKERYSYTKENLSAYATTNNKELVAEAWMEYINNPNPRTIAKTIGDYILDMYEKRLND